jgi:hypothetical protein
MRIKYRITCGYVIFLMPLRLEKAVGFGAGGIARPYPGIYPKTMATHPAQ